MKKLFFLYIALFLLIFPVFSQTEAYKLKVKTLKDFPNVIIDGASYSFDLPIIHLGNQNILSGTPIQLNMSINGDPATVLTSFSINSTLHPNDSVSIPISNYQFESARFGGGGGPVADITIWPTVMNVEGEHTSFNGTIYINAAAFSVQNRNVTGLPMILSVYRTYSVEILTQNVGIMSNQNEIDFYAQIDSFPIEPLTTLNQQVPVGGQAQTKLPSFQLSSIFPSIVSALDLKNESHVLQIWAIERGKYNAVNRAAFQIQAGVLPVSLTEFKGDIVIESNKIDISWSTNSEDQNAAFHLEKYNESLKEFELLSVITGSGTTNQNIHYLATDKMPNVGANRYRLVQHDLDGSNSVCSKKDLIVNYIAEKSLQIVYSSPNPFSNSISLRVFNGLKNKIFAQVYDIQGKLVHKSVLEGQTGTIDIEIPTPDFPKGIYFYEVSNGEEKYVGKLVKE